VRRAAASRPLNKCAVSLPRMDLGLSGRTAIVCGATSGMGLAVAEGGQRPQAYPAHAVSLVDTHGAGDTFIGALAAQLAQGASLSEATRFANAAASLFVSTPTDQKKSVTFDRVTRFLSDRKPLG